MLILCPECHREVSDKTSNCPHCGYPIQTTEAAEETPSSKPRRAPISLVLAIIALILSLSTPRFLLFFPIMATLGGAAISLIRREKGPAWALLVMVLGVGLLFIVELPNTATPGADQMADLSTVEITDWNWTRDPDFGGHGAIKWNVQIHNLSSRNISMVKVQLTTYDKTGKLIASTDNYVTAIPANGTRSDQSFADLYGTENNAKVQITDVQFSN